MTGTSSSSDIVDRFAVTPWMDRVGRHLFERPKLMRSLARMETKLFEDRMEDIPLVSPIWVSGLARSGSTVLLELLAAHPEVATQRYRDFPPVFTPILWNRLVFMTMQVQMSLRFLILRPLMNAETQFLMLFGGLLNNASCL